MKKPFLFFTFIILANMSAPAYAYFDLLDELLKEHTKIVSRNGITYNGVNYDAWAKDPRHEKVLDKILSIDPSSLESKNEQLSYWINAYNLLTIDLINTKNERQTIKNLGTLFTSAWKNHTWTFADGKQRHLDNIEHDIIRKMGDPRIHFAVNCAAKSCPDLRAEAYRPNKIDKQLNEQVRLTFNNPTKGYDKIEDENTVRVTKVMDWFKADFSDGNLKNWLQTNYPNVVNDSTKIIFFNYDWSLNKQ